METDHENYVLALEKACEYIFDNTGGCPLDMGCCMYPSKIGGCDGEEIGCWEKYFLSRWT